MVELLVYECRAQQSLKPTLRYLWGELVVRFPAH